MFYTFGLGFSLMQRIFIKGFKISKWWGILVCSGCQNKIPQIGRLKHQHFISHSFGARSLRWRRWKVPVLLRPLLGSQMAAFPCPPLAVPLCACVPSASYKDTRCKGRGPLPNGLPLT